MSHYLCQVSYTTEAWEKLIKSPQNRFDIVRPAIEKLGGKVETSYFAFGEYDAVLIMQMQDNVSAAAIAMAFAAGGSLKGVKTTPLLTAAEGLEAMKKAAGSGYKPVAKAAGAGR